MNAIERSYLHRGGALALCGATVDDAFRATVERYPDAEAIVGMPQDRRLSWAELEEHVETLARSLLALGVEPGERVGVWATNHIEWVLIQLATARVGALLVNINPAYRSAELEDALVRVGIRTLFLIPRFRQSDYIEILRSVCPEIDRGCGAPLCCDRVPELRDAVAWDPFDLDRSERFAPGLLTWSEVIARGRRLSSNETEARATSLDADDAINIQFTSGTTGAPKAVVLTHHNIVNNALFTGERLALTSKDRVCVPVPFYHCFGMVVANLACITHASTIVIPAEHFDAGATLAAIESEHCTAVHGVPTMFLAGLEHAERRERDLGSLRTGIMAGAPCPPELVSRVMNELHCPEILIGYGQTEASPITHLTRRDDSLERRIGTVGTNLEHQEVKVIDPSSGATQPVGVDGEVCFRGYHVMHGYWGNEAATRRTIDAAGWLHSGDTGVLDTEGYLRITGRLKDMIIRGGENIYPAEIEAFYFDHPSIADIAICGVPDERLGEDIAAWVRLELDATTSAEDLRQWAKGRIAHFKIPRYIWFVDEMPMTVTGKVQKFRLREMAEERLASAHP